MFKKLQEKRQDKPLVSKRLCHFSTNKTLSKIDTLSFFLEIAYIESSQRATSANGKKSNPRQQLSYLFFLT